MKSKFLLLSLLITALFTTSLSAQDQKHELGLQLRSFNDFDFIYKKKRAENKFTRFRIGSINFSYADNNMQGSQSTVIGNIQLSIGWENRKYLTEKFQFFHGFEPHFAINAASAGNESRTQSQISFRPGLGYVLGFQYVFSDNILINLETIPSITSSFTFNNSGINTYRLGASFAMSDVALGLLYRF